MSKKEYEVFLCFEGSGTTQVFTDCLYDALNEAGVSVFRSSEGTQIPTVEHALQDSDICIVVLSQGFSWSAWCLSQVAEMVKLEKHIVPIFYGVKPHDVIEFNSDVVDNHLHLNRRETVINWSEALTKIARIKGGQQRGDTGFNEFCEDITEDILGLIRDSSFLTVREFLRDEPKAQRTKMTITYEYENNEGQTITLLSSTRGDGTADFQRKITAIPLGGTLELCMEDNKRFSSLHKKIITPALRSNKRKTAYFYFHGHYISVEDWCEKLYAIIEKHHKQEDHGTISAWWWKHAEDFIKSIARDIGSAMRAVHQAGQYHGNIADGIYIGVEPSKLNDTADPTSMVDGGVVYRKGTNIIERVNIKTDLKSGYIGNFRRRDETGASVNQAADLAAIYKVLVYMITYADMRKGTDGFKTFDQLKGLGIDELIDYGKERLVVLAKSVKKLAEDVKDLAEEKIQLAQEHKMAAEAKKKSAKDKIEKAKTAKRSAKCKEESTEAKKELWEAKKELTEAKKELTEAKKELTEAEKPLAEANEQLAEAKEQLAAAPEILRDLNSFLECSSKACNKSFPMGWIFGHPYLFNAGDALDFVEKLYHFIFRELDNKVLKYVEREYNPPNLANWRDRAKNSTIVQYAYNHVKPKRGETIPEGYKSTISCIKAFRNCLEHHCNELTKLAAVKRILKDFNILPDIFESMEELMKSLSNYKPPNQQSTSDAHIAYDKELFRTLGWQNLQDSAIKDIKIDDTWFCIQLSERSSEDKIIGISIRDIMMPQPMLPISGQIKSSARFAAYGTAESFFYYVGGIVSESTNHTISKCNYDQFMVIPTKQEKPEGFTEEHIISPSLLSKEIKEREEQLPQWEPMSKNPSPVALLWPFTLEVDGHIFLYGREAKREDLRRLGVNQTMDVEAADSKGPATSAYLYHMKNDTWLPNVANPSDATWFVVNFFSWRSPEGQDKLMVVLKEYTDQKPLDHVQDKLRICCYNFTGNNWDYIMHLECSNYYGKEQFVEVNGVLFHIRGENWHVYDLKEKKSKGVVQGLESLLKIPGFNLDKDGSTDGLDGVSRFTTSSDSSSLVFCATWISYDSPKDLHFAVISIEDYQLGKILTSCYVQLDGRYYFGRCFAIRGPLLKPESEASTSSNKKKCES